ncbi:uncharacterized protein LOC143535662 [Bidens hawaiensis]|uniref:uncharacterized protein LOC143535662 n=1 Tax=Bidens hawaiensis TaxID=980011 RepID=UPI004049E263
MADLHPLIFIILYLGCFITFYTTQRRPKPSRKHHNSITSTWSFIKRIFSSKPDPDHSNIFQQIPSTSSSTRSTSIITPETRMSTRPGSLRGSDYFPLRNETEIHPCPICGEIFQKPGSLEQHQSIKHAICEMLDDDPGTNVVRMIFISGWPGENPTIHRVMKINNSPKILTRFEEYRESVKSKATQHHASERRRDERCVADGNELLRFYCTTFLCDLGQNGNSTLCTQQYCSVCNIIGSGFSPKMDGVSTLPNSWKGHVSIPDDIEEEFGFMCVKRAMLVCRVIAGRVGCDQEINDKNDSGYDSLVGKEHGAVQRRLDDEDELIVFNPRAVLPCFVIVYTV